MSALCEAIQKLGKGIENPTRYRILQVLMSGPKTVTEILGSVMVSQPAVSQHLQVLQACQLVTRVRWGQEVRYALDTNHMLYVLQGLTKNVSKTNNKVKQKN